MDENIPTAETIDSIPTAPIVDMIDPLLGIEITEDMKKCYKLSNSIKYLSWIECILSMLFTFSNGYFAIPLFLMYFGYIGAKNFNQNLIGLYFIYLTAINAARLYFFLHFFTQLSYQEREVNIMRLMLVIVCSMMDFFVSYVTYLFYKSMKKLPAANLEIIRLLDQELINNSS